jgi:hypothetical protein
MNVCMYVSHMVLTTNINYFLKPYLLSLCNGETCVFCETGTIIHMYPLPNALPFLQPVST